MVTPGWPGVPRTRRRRTPRSSSSAKAPRRSSTLTDVTARCRAAGPGHAGTRLPGVAVGGVSGWVTSGASFRRRRCPTQCASPRLPRASACSLRCTQVALSRPLLWLRGLPARPRRRRSRRRRRVRRSALGRSRRAVGEDIPVLAVAVRKREHSGEFGVSRRKGCHRAAVQVKAVVGEAVPTEATGVPVEPMSGWWSWARRIPPVAPGGLPAGSVVADQSGPTAEPSVLGSASAARVVRACRTSAAKPGSWVCAVVCKISRSIDQYPWTIRLRSRDGCCHGTCGKRSLTSAGS
jgi:hypothetical protein